MVISTYESVWFKNKETSLAMAIDNAFETLGVMVMFFIQPSVYEGTKSLFVCFGIVTVTCVGSLIAGVVLVYIDVYAPKEDEDTEKEAYKHFSWSLFKEMGSGFWYLTASHMFIGGAASAMSNIISAFFQDRFGLDADTAGYVAGSSPLLMAIVAIPLGLFLHKYGYKTHVSNLFDFP